MAATLPATAQPAPEAAPPAQTAPTPAPAPPPAQPAPAPPQATRPATPGQPVTPIADPSAPLPPLPNLGVPWPSSNAPPADPGEPVEEGSTLIDYRVELTGAPKAVDASFDEFSVLRNTEEPANLAQIELRAEEDVELLDRLLRSNGYYSATTTVDVEPAPAPGGQAVVTLAVDPGERYDFGEIEVVAPPGPARQLIVDRLELKEGEALDAAEVLAAEGRVRLALPEEGYPFAKVEDPAIVVDHRSETARFQLEVDPGPLTRFGEIRVEGDSLVSARHISTLARFDEGDVYDQRLVTDLRRALIATGLFSSVAVRPERVPDIPAGKGTDAAPPPGGTAFADLIVSTTPAPLRTLAGEVGYDTEDGFRLEASWRHRNLLPPEGAVTFRGVVGTREQSLSANLLRSNFRERDQVLAAFAALAHEDVEAYESYNFGLGARIERQTTLVWQKAWTYSYGAELLAARERDRGLSSFATPERNFFLAALPAFLGYDGSNDLLDPTEGFRLLGRVSPEASLQGDFAYLKAELEGSVYLPVSDSFVLASRAAVGSLTGAARDVVPPSRRFYVGGGGSVRGYGYQDIGPEDADNDPLGGRAYTELSLEARYRFGNFGIVPFIDAGSLNQQSYPNLENLQFGAGLGARYYSQFGPIRIDVATPLNPEPDDPTVAVYVSIGQAF